MAHQPGAVKDLPHGVCNAILLPASRSSTGITPSSLRPHRSAMGVDARGTDDETASKAAIQVIKDLSKTVGIPSGFAELGVTAADLPTLVEKAQQDPCAPANPVAIKAL